MKNFFIITLILLIQSFPSFGSVDGKGIVCKCLDCKLEHLDPSSYMPNNIPTEIGFHFKINKVAIYYIRKIGDKIKVSENIQTTLRKKKRFLSDENSINWLINSYASVAIVPFSSCEKYLRVDSRLSMFFPDKGVPLMWNFLLTKSKFNNRILIDWLKTLEKKDTIDKLAYQGWYLPFKNEYSQNKYNIQIANNTDGPSKKWWENSWSFPLLNKKEKLNLENLWNQSLTP